jgi:2-oxoglutarate dehydrogenase E1 component
VRGAAAASPEFMTGLIDKTSFLTSANSTFVAELYARYLEKPATVDSEWAAFF